MKSKRRYKKRRLFSWRKYFALFCFSLFAIQVTKLIMQYNKGKTVVNIEISHLFKEGPPGITIGPADLDIVKMATIHDKYKKLHQEYVKAFYNSTDDYFRHKYNQIVREDINQGLLSLADIFKNYTYDYEEELKMNNLNLFVQMAADNDDGLLNVMLLLCIAVCILSITISILKYTLNIP